jgi:hypothetical protein
MFPDASAAALGLFDQASGCATLSALRVVAPVPMWRRALEAALPMNVGDTPGTAVARACADGDDVDGNDGGGGGSADTLPPLLNSREQRRGMGSFSDWAAAQRGGVPSARALTAPLAVGSLPVGFATLHFAHAPHDGADERADAAALRALADAVGGAVFLLRASAISDFGSRAASAALSSSSAAGRPLSPRQRAAALARPFAAATHEEENAEHAVYPSSDADAAALAALDASLDADVATLRDGALDPWALPDEALPPLLAAMFHARGLLRALRLSPRALSAFVACAADGYEADPSVVPFHNLRHAFTVMHAAWRFLDAEGEPRLLHEPLDCLALLIAALCHDLGHPGTNNAYHVNTGSVLALRYNDASVLESHHAAACFELLERSRLLAPLSGAQRAALRRTVIQAILSTDSACLTLTPPRMGADVLCVVAQWRRTRRFWRAWRRRRPRARLARAMRRRSLSDSCASPSCCTARTCARRSCRTRSAGA